MSQKCWHKPSENKTAKREEKFEEAEESKERENQSRKSEFWVQKKFKNFSSVVSSRWSGF